MTTLRPTPFFAATPAYRAPVRRASTDLRLDGNEGPPSTDVLSTLSEVDLGELVRRYPDARPLEEHIATRFGVDPESVLVTAGVDDALDRGHAFSYPDGETRSVGEPAARRRPGDQ